MQSNDNVDVLDAPAARRFRQPGDAHGLGGNIMQAAVRRIEEMVMGRDVGVEINAARVDKNLAQQAGFGELMQCVVDGGERYARPVLARGVMHLFGRHVLMTTVEQHCRQRHALPRRAQADGLQKRG